MLKKRLTAKQEKKLDEIKKTYPDIKLIDHNEFVRLWHPDIFPETNKPRLYNNVSKKVLRSFSDFHYAFMRLPNSYQVKLLISREFDDFMVNVEQYAKNVDRTQTKEPEKLFSFLMYYNFFTIGIEGLLNTMPEEFKYYIRDELRPILVLMQSIADFTKKSNPKYKTPFIHAPEILQNSSTLDSLR